MDNFTDNSTTGQAKAQADYFHPQEIIRNKKERWSAGKQYWRDGIPCIDDAPRAIRALSYYFYVGDKALGILALQDPEERTKKILAVIQRLNLSEAELESIQKEVYDCCHWSKDKKQPEKAKIGQQSGNERLGREAAQRINIAYDNFYRKQGRVPGLNELCKIARCGKSTAIKFLAQRKISVVAEPVQPSPVVAPGMGEPSQVNAGEGSRVVQPSPGLVSIDLLTTKRINSKGIDTSVPDACTTFSSSPVEALGGSPINNTSPAMAPTGAKSDSRELSLLEFLENIDHGDPIKRDALLRAIFDLDQDHCENNRQKVSETKTSCRSCGAPIDFVSNQKTGKYMPVEPGEAIYRDETFEPGRHRPHRCR